MKDYAKPCIGENYPGHVIWHVGINELHYKLTPKRILKSVTGVAKSLVTSTRLFSIYSIIPCSKNYNNKAMEINKRLCKMRNKEKLFFLEDRNKHI